MCYNDKFSQRVKFSDTNTKYHFVFNLMKNIINVMYGASEQMFAD